MYPALPRITNLNKGRLYSLAQELSRILVVYAERLRKDRATASQDSRSEGTSGQLPEAKEQERRTSVRGKARPGQLIELTARLYLLRLPDYLGTGQLAYKRSLCRGVGFCNHNERFSLNSHSARFPI
jgi:hypothetical protein